MLKKKIANFLAAIMVAYGYGALTYLIFFIITDENLLISTILNTTAIIFIIISEKAEKIYAKPEAKSETGTPSVIKRVSAWLFSGEASVKSGLYLFYVVVIISEALLAAEPGLPFLSSHAYYISSVSYGLLILIAVDAFIGQLFKNTPQK